MEIVSNNSEEDFERKRLRDEVTRATTEMTANMLRVLRGAGKPYLLPENALELAQAIIALEKVARGSSQDVMVCALNRDLPPDRLAKMSENHWQQWWAMHHIVGGSLQIAASNLLGQTTQEAAGKSELHQGMRDLEVAYKEERKRFDAPHAPQVEKAPDSKPSRSRSKSPKSRLSRADGQ